MFGLNLEQESTHSHTHTHGNTHIALLARTRCLRSLAALSPLLLNTLSPLPSSLSSLLNSTFFSPNSFPLSERIASPFFSSAGKTIKGVDLPSHVFTPLLGTYPRQEPGSIFSPEVAPKKFLFGGSTLQWTQGLLLQCHSAKGLLLVIVWGVCLTVQLHARVALIAL